MDPIVNEAAELLENRQVGPRLYLMRLAMPSIARSVLPGQFVHLKVPDAREHILRRPFSIYDADAQAGTCDILYQAVGSLTQLMTTMAQGTFEAMGPIGRGWTFAQRLEAGQATHGLLVGGGVGAAPLFLLAKEMRAAGTPFDVVLGAQTKDAHVCLDRYQELCQGLPDCSTDDGSFGTPGFCTSLVDERLRQGCKADGFPYDYVAVCGPEPLMRIASVAAQQAGAYCEVSLEKRMACGIGACLSCVVNTVDGKRRSCVDGPVFPSSKVVW